MFEFKFEIVLFYFSFTLVSFRDSRLLVSWGAGDRCGMTCSDEDCDKIRRPGAEDSQTVVSRTLPQHAR
jgi:hypothetical protein